MQRHPFHSCRSQRKCLNMLEESCFAILMRLDKLYFASFSDVLISFFVLILEEKHKEKEVSGKAWIN